VKGIVESGSTANTIDEETWEPLKRNKLQCYEKKKKEKNYFPMEVQSHFWVKLSLIFHLITTHLQLKE